MKYFVFSPLKPADVHSFAISQPAKCFSLGKIFLYVPAVTSVFKIVVGIRSGFLVAQVSRLFYIFQIKLFSKKEEYILNSFVPLVESTIRKNDEKFEVLGQPN